MKMRLPFLGFLLITFALPAFALDGRAEFDAAVTNAIAKLNRQASVDAEDSMRLAELIQREYGTREEELKWAVDNGLSWGEITALAYIQATTGRSFALMNREIAPMDGWPKDARRDFWSYAENAGMSSTKMAHSLENFMRRAEKEGNSRIFERLRASRRVHPLPDLGSGFGLFQEALDFRRIDSPRPTKIHDGQSVRTKGQ